MKEIKEVFADFIPIGVFIAAWVLWAFWLPDNQNVWAELALKTVLFGGCPLILMLCQRKADENEWVVVPRKLLKAPFPIFVCVTSVCLSIVFLYTLRIWRGLTDTYVIFEWYPLAASVWAGIVEEFFFRGYLFGRMKPVIGFIPAALLNGVMFVLYHYPEWLFDGGFSGFLSFRTGLIFIMSIIFCTLFQRWRCIGLNMIVHTVWDILSYFFCVG